MPTLANPGLGLMRGFNAGMGIVRREDKRDAARQKQQRQSVLDKQKQQQLEVEELDAQISLAEKQITMAGTDEERTAIRNSVWAPLIEKRTGKPFHRTESVSKQFADLEAQMMQVDRGNDSPEIKKAKIEGLESIMKRDHYKKYKEYEDAGKEKQKQAEKDAQARALEISQILDSGQVTDKAGQLELREELAILHKTHKRAALDGVKEFSDQKHKDTPKSTDALLVKMSGDISGRTGQRQDEVLAEIKKAFKEKSLVDTSTPTKIEIVAASLGVDLGNLDEESAQSIIVKLQEMSKSSLGSFAEQLQTHISNPKKGMKAWILEKLGMGGDSSSDQPQVPKEITNEANQLFK